MASDKEICVVCATPLTFTTKPNFGGGKLNDGGRVCRECFRKIAELQTDFGMKSKSAYSTTDVLNLLGASPKVRSPEPSSGKRLSEKPRRILLARTEMTESEIDSLSDQEAWGLIYSLDQDKSPKERKPEVCFTGFTPNEKAELMAFAEDVGLHAVKSITKHLDILVTGPNPGPVKVEKATEQGVPILEFKEFEHLIKTGEFPDCYQTDNQ